MSANDTALRPTTGRLLGRVALRQRLASFARRGYLSAIGLAVVYGLLLLTSRLLGVIPNWFEPTTLLLIPGGALLLGLVLHHRPRAPEAARLIDTQTGANDLFLTAALLEGAPGAYKPLVLGQAEQRAAEIAPSEVVPVVWLERVLVLVGLLCALFLGVRFLPQLDPFGNKQAQAQQEERRRALAESRKAVKLRVALLKKAKAQAERTAEVEHQVGELKNAFRKMKPKAPKENFERLTAVQKELNDLWRMRSEQRLKQAFEQMQQAQRVGSGESQKAERWKRRLKRGDAEPLKKEMNEIKDMARQLEQLSDPSKKQALQKEITKRMKNLSDFLANNVSSKSMEEAVERALEQLKATENKELSKEAAKALKESLDLTKLEAEKLAQAVRDMKALEEALKAAQLAKQANQRLGGVDGQCEGCQGCKTLGDYAEFYKKLMEGAKQGEVGPGMGPNPVSGRGGEAPEKPDEQTDFLTERAKSALKAGRILMQWKTRELSKAGEVKEDYRRKVEAVKEGAAEAILTEQVPPGYHDAIQKYFDSLKEAPKKP